MAKILHISQKTCVLSETTLQRKIKDWSFRINNKKTDLNRKSLRQYEHRQKICWKNAVKKIIFVQRHAKKKRKNIEQNEKINEKRKIGYWKQFIQIKKLTIFFKT